MGEGIMKSLPYLQKSFSNHLLISVQIGSLTPNRFAKMHKKKSFPFRIINLPFGSVSDLGKAARIIV
jgi:hypothetical protein